MGPNIFETSTKTRLTPPWKFLKIFGWSGPIGLIGISRLSLLSLQINWDNIFIPAFRAGHCHYLYLLALLPRSILFIANCKTTKKSFIESIFQLRIPQSCELAIMAAELTHNAEDESPICDVAIPSWVNVLDVWDWRCEVIRVMYGGPGHTRDTWWMRLTLHNNKSTDMTYPGYLAQVLLEQLGLKMGPDITPSFVFCFIQKK